MSQNRSSDLAGTKERVVKILTQEGFTTVEGDDVCLPSDESKIHIFCNPNLKTVLDSLVLLFGGRAGIYIASLNMKNDLWRIELANNEYTEQAVQIHKVLTEHFSDRSIEIRANKTS